MNIKHVSEYQYVKNSKVAISEGLDICLVPCPNPWKPGATESADSDMLYLTQGNGGQEITLTRDQAASLARKLTQFVNYLDMN